jgi:hypothetical protein
MKFFGDRSRTTGRLERDLRANRSRPAKDVVDRIVAIVEGAPTPVRGSKHRWAIAALVGVASVLAFATFGGIGYAQSSATHAVSNTYSSIANLIRVDQSNSPQQADSKDGKKGSKGDDPRHPSGNDEKGHHDDDDPGDDEYREKVLICHRPPGNPGNAHTISVPPSAVPAHLAHGDTLGPCPKDKH